MREWGHVYVVNCRGIYKIGYTNGSVRQRVAAIQVTSPSPVRLVCAIPTTTPMVLERIYHERYQAKRIRGEWYRLTQREIKELINEERQGRSTQIRTEIQEIMERSQWMA
jgi:hypothetical protein